jgi:hypothetical protein
MKIHNVRIYKIQIYGQVKEEDINRSSPLQFKLEQEGEDNTFVSVRSDQSGFVGLIRHLHGLGLVLVSMSSTVEQPLNCCSETLDDIG